MVPLQKLNPPGVAGTCLRKLFPSLVSLLSVGSLLVPLGSISKYRAVWDLQRDLLSHLEPSFFLVLLSFSFGTGSYAAQSGLALNM